MPQSAGLTAQAVCLGQRGERGRLRAWIVNRDEDALDAGHGPCCRHVRRNRASDALFARLSDFRTAA